MRPNASDRARPPWCPDDGPWPPRRGPHGPPRWSRGPFLFRFGVFFLPALFFAALGVARLVWLASEQAGLDLPRPVLPLAAFAFLLIVVPLLFWGGMRRVGMPLGDIVEAAEAHDAAVMVDDAHASGVLGRDGRGSVDHFGLHGRVAIQVGTLSKAVGVVGGYVAGSTALRELLTQRSRPFLFSTSHPPAVAAACREALKVFVEEPWRIERLWSSTKRFKTELARLGFDTGRSETPITPIIVGDSGLANRFSARLFEEGVFATSVVYPTVALDQARLRTIVTAALSDEQLDRALGTLDKVGRELGVISG